MKNQSKFKKPSKGGALIAGLAFTAGIAVAVALPIAGGILAGTAVAGALAAGAGGTVCGIVAGLMSASVIGSVVSPLAFLGVTGGVAAVGSLTKFAITKTAGLIGKGVSKLFGKKQALAKKAAPQAAVPAQVEVSAFKATTAKASFDAATAVKTAAANANKAAPQKKPAGPKAA